jgi:hypothetical protein
MDEDKKAEQNNIDLKTKETVESQLDSYINPNEKGKSSINAAAYYAESETNKEEPLIKVGNVPAPEKSQKQNRPIIRTYKSDVEETIQTGHISSINIALAENKKMMGVARQTEIEANKKTGINKSILIISIV